MKAKRLLFLVMAICLVSGVNAQRVRKHKIEEDGFEWYQIVIDNKKCGAEDKYGNTIIPTIYTLVDYATFCGLYETHKYFMVANWEQATDKTTYGIHNRKGECIIPISRGYTWIEKSKGDKLPIGTYYLCWHGNDECSICDIYGEERCTVRSGMSNQKKIYLMGTVKIKIIVIQM